MLSDTEIATIDTLLFTLGSAQPWFSRTPRNYLRLAVTVPPHQLVLATSGNWYDGHKAELLSVLARTVPTSELLLTGGACTEPWNQDYRRSDALLHARRHWPPRCSLVAHEAWAGRAERLTSAAAALVGGESLLLQQRLREMNVPSRQMVLWTGSRVTSHNLHMILGPTRVLNQPEPAPRFSLADASCHFARAAYAKQRSEFSGGRSAVHLWIVEEFLLVRRMAAGLHSLFAVDAEARAAVTSVRFLAVGPRQFNGLVTLHGGRAEVALALVMGEYRRLQAYSRPGNETTTTHGIRQHPALVPAGALDNLSKRLRRQLVDLETRHGAPGGLLAEGRRILERAPREEMLRLATPSSSAMKRTYYVQPARTT